MQSDTVVGIVGAVVLVAVMVGVFAYEYNNAPVEEPEMTDEQMARESFNETYAFLDGSGDIDGDGTPNWDDMDLDGDGTDNANDTDVKFYDDFTGSLSASTPATPQSWSETFEAEMGLIHTELSLTAPAVVNGQSVGALSVSVTGSDGQNYPATASVVGSDIVYTVDIEDVAPGTFTVNVSYPNGLGPAVSFTGSLAFHYDA